MTQQEIDTIHAWLDSGRNYADGIRLLEKHSKNQAMTRIFEGREYRYAVKLAYELRKLITDKPSLKAPEPKKVKPSGLHKPWPVNLDLQEIRQTDPNLPPIIVRIIAEFSDLYNNRSIAHKSLKAIPPDNRQENVEYRRITVEKIRGYSDRMEELHHYHEEYNTKNIIPDQQILYPSKKPVAPTPEPDDLDKLAHLRSNLIKSLNRDNNLVNFQAITKQPVSSPMPAGPRRTALLSRIKERKTEIAKLNSRLDGINKVLSAVSPADGKQ